MTMFQLFRNFDHDGLAGRKEQLFEENFGVEVGHVAARVEDDGAAGVDPSDGLKRFRRTSKVCDKNVPIASAVEPLKLYDILKCWGKIFSFN